MRVSTCAVSPDRALLPMLGGAALRSWLITIAVRMLLGIVARAPGFKSPAVERHRGPSHFQVAWTSQRFWDGQPTLLQMTRTTERPLHVPRQDHRSTRTVEQIDTLNLLERIEAPSDSALATASNLSRNITEGSALNRAIMP